MDENEEKLSEQRWGLKGDSFCIWDPYYCRTVFDDESSFVQQQVTHPIGRGRSGSVGSALESPSTPGKLNVTSIPTESPSNFSITTNEKITEQYPKIETPPSSTTTTTPKRGHRRTHSEQLRGSISISVLDDTLPPSTPPPLRTRRRSNTEDSRVTDNTIQKVKTFKTYLEEFYWELFTYIHSRALREQKFNLTLKQKRQRRHIEVETLTREHRKKETLLLRTRRLCGRLTDFHFLKLIGKGAYGEVFLCRRASTGELLALKKLSKTKLHVKNQIAHVKTEQDVLSADASSQWLVHLLYAFQDSENIYFAMEFIPGGDLRSFCEKEHDLSERDAKFYSAEMFLAVDALHKLGYIHRDLKPDNFLIDKEGHLKLADFGLSKKGVNESYGEPFQGQMPSVKLFTPNAIIRREAYRKTRTKVYSMVGSPDYMAVELLRGKGYNFESDWWSLGCILYEMICGFPPFCADTPHEVFSNVMHYQTTLENPELDDGQPLLSPLAWDLITNLITEPETRLGVNGIDEIKKHPFFAEVDWMNIKSQWCPPFIPHLENEEDTKYFDRAEPLSDADLANMLLPSQATEPGPTFLEKLQNIPKSDINFDEISFSKAIFERERSLSNSSDDDPIIRSPRDKQSPRKSPRSVGKASSTGMLGRMLRKVSSIESLSHFVKVSSRGSKSDRKISEKPAPAPFPLSLDNLSLHDWKVFITGAVRITLPKDTVVMREGDYNRFLYRIRRGCVRVEKMTIHPTPDSTAFNPLIHSNSTDSTSNNNENNEKPSLSGYSIVLTKLERGQVFGEMSFVEDSWVFDSNVSKSHVDSSVEDPTSLGGNVSASVIVDSDEAEFYRIDRSFAFYLFRHDKTLFARFYKIVAIMLANRDKNLPLRNFIDSMEQTTKSPVTPTIMISQPSSSKSSPNQSPRVSMHLNNSDKDTWLGPPDKPNMQASGVLSDSNASNTSTQSITSSDNESDSTISVPTAGFLTSSNDRKEKDRIKEKKKKKEKKSKSRKLRASSDSLVREKKSKKKKSVREDDLEMEKKSEKDVPLENKSDKEDSKNSYKEDLKKSDKEDSKKSKKSNDAKSDKDEKKEKKSKRASFKRQKSDPDLRKSLNLSNDNNEKSYKSDKELRRSKTELSPPPPSTNSEPLRRRSGSVLSSKSSDSDLTGKKKDPELTRKRSDPLFSRKKSDPEFNRKKEEKKLRKSNSDLRRSTKETKSDKESRDSDRDSKSDKDVRKSDKDDSKKSDSDKSSTKEDEPPKSALEKLRSLRRRSLDKPLSAIQKLYQLQNHSDGALIESVSSKLNLEHNNKNPSTNTRALVHSSTWDVLSSNNNNEISPDIIRALAANPPSNKRITFNSIPELREESEKPKEKMTPKKGHKRSKSQGSPLSSQESIQSIEDVEIETKKPSKKAPHDEVVIVEITSEDTKEQDRKVKKQNSRFRRRFKLPPGEFVVLKYQCVYSRDKHRYHGKLYLGKNHLCFYSKIFGFRKKKVIKFKHIKTITRMEGAITVVSDGKQYLFSEFPDPRSVSEVYDMLDRIHHSNLQSITPRTDGSAYISTDEYSSLSEWDTSSRYNSEHEELASPRLRSLSEAEQKELNRSNDNNTPQKSDTSTEMPFKGISRTSSRKSSLDRKLIGSPSTFNNTRIWEEEELTLALTLNQNEWDLILNGAEFLTYIKDEVIVKQGCIPGKIFQIASGMCRIEIVKDNKQQVIGTLATSEMFGEISVLTEVGPATMSIVADTTNVDVYAIPREHITDLFLKHPGLEGKFYKFIALVLARRIRQRELEEQFRLSAVKDRVFLTHLA